MRLIDWAARLLYVIAHRVRRVYWYLLRPKEESAHVAVWSGGKVLVVRTSYRRALSLPAGGLGRGEPPRSGALRELEEETGVSLDEMQVSLFDVLVDTSEHKEDHAHVFEAALAEPPPVQVDRREIVWAGFLTPDELRKARLTSALRAYLERKLKDSP